MTKKFVLFALAFIACFTCDLKQADAQPTYCNPLNLSYRFCLDQPSRREAADPTIVLYKDNYYLFASKSGGYWVSNDLLSWKMVTTKDLPIENYAPTAVVIGDWLYFFTSESHTIYRSTDPASGKWEVYNDKFPIAITDPMFFADTDGKVYFYYGCSNVRPLYAIELDVNNKLMPIGKAVEVFGGMESEHGWEVPGDYNTKNVRPWIEGSWMTKHDGKYYLQYAGPGTEYKAYGDGVYVSDKPLGPFVYADNNPFSSRPEGFAAAAGHGATFADKYGNYWHIATQTISVKHMFERRLGLFPTNFDKNGNLYTTTDFGDYPIIMPKGKYDDVSKLRTDWAMLSYNKKADASSSIDKYPVSFAFDEDMRTYWSAKTGNKGEWLSVDLGSVCTINAVQLNFGENDCKQLGRDGVKAQQYLVEYSTDNKTWKTLIDKTSNEEDLSHPYTVLDKPVKAQYVKITNYRVAGDGTFAVSGLRLFGKGTGKKPEKVASFKIERNAADQRSVSLSWDAKANATGYNIRFGVGKDMLYRSYQVNGKNSVTINSLDKGKSYWFQVDAFGENGVTPGVVQFVK
jgi:hypothetical protein